MNANSFVAVVWTLGFYFFLMFIFLSLLVAVFMNAYDSSLAELGGYPEDQKTKFEFT